MKQKTFTKYWTVLLPMTLVVFTLALQGCSSDIDPGFGDPTTTIATVTTTTTTTTTLPAVAGVTQATNVFLGHAQYQAGDILADNNYTFMHGSTSPDQSKFFVVTNARNADQSFGSLNFTSNLYMLDTASVTQGAAALDTTVTNNTGTAIGDGSGPQGATISFRSSWTPDGSKILLAGGDRFYVLNADTLAVLNSAQGAEATNQGDTTIGGANFGQNHDAMPTSDGKYALLTLRTKPFGNANNDGELQLYDLTTYQPVGEPISVCNSCHISAGKAGISAVLCGIDGTVTVKEDGTYEGTVYVAGHGGHISKIALTINPTNETTPIVVSLNKLTISNVKFKEGDSQYKLHDVRLAGETLYWSTYNTDANGQVHYGKINVAGTGLADVAYNVDERAVKPGAGLNMMPIYCASGQTADYFMPITMTSEAYITVIPKEDITGQATPPPSVYRTQITEATNVFIDALMPDNNYTYMHGSTSPDGSKFLVYVNDRNDGQAFGALNFTSDFYMLDTNSVVAGQPALADTTTNKASVTGDGSGPQAATISFRSSWTPDGSKVLVSAADRVYVLDSDTLAVLNGNTPGNQGDTTVGGANNGQIHDMLSSGDGKYALLAARTTPYGDTKKDGEIQLYDVVNGQPIGEPVSVCNACHVNQLGAANSAVLCGITGEFSPVTVTAPGYGGGTTTTYPGTVYVAGHGGHIAVVDITVDPTQAAPITINSLDKIVISSLKFNTTTGGAVGSSQYKLHDVRKDGDTIYWSTYNTDANMKAHYGKINIDGSSKVDVAYPVDPRATAPAIGVDTMPIYCASGQTAGYFMPITMTNEAYITVIPKATIVAP